MFVTCTAVIHNAEDARLVEAHELHEAYEE